MEFLDLRRGLVTSVQDPVLKGIGRNPIHWRLDKFPDNDNETGRVH